MGKQYNYKHGAASRQGGSRRSSKLYAIWSGVKQRCFNPRSTQYHRYGGRGITMQPEWVEDFACFAADVGEPPEDGMTLDRIDNDLGYVRGNTRWIGRKEQANNRADNVRLAHDGKTMTLMQWSEHLGWPYSLLSGRWKKGKRGEELFAPTRVAKYKTKVEYGGRSMTLREWARETGVPYETLWWRHKNGKPLL
jgi:hypothetical protein